MPTDYGFTGQRSDATTGLQYFGSRFYDPAAGQFVSADTILPGNGLDPPGLSRYAYVEGNPVDRTDPSGHYMDDGSGGRAFQNYNTGAVVYYPVHLKPIYIPPPPHWTRPVLPWQRPAPRPTPAAHPSASKASGTTSGLNPWDILENVHPVIYVWRHAEAIDASGLDPTGIASVMAAIKMQAGWSGDQVIPIKKTSRSTCLRHFWTPGPDQPFWRRSLPTILAPSVHMP
jgi:RHS repeat-associated protein